MKILDFLCTFNLVRKKKARRINNFPWTLFPSPNSHPHPYPPHPKRYQKLFQQSHSSSADLCQHSTTWKTLESSSLILRELTCPRDTAHTMWRWSRNHHFMRTEPLPQPLLHKCLYKKLQWSKGKIKRFCHLFISDVFHSFVLNSEYRFTIIKNTCTMFSDITSTRVFFSNTSSSCSRKVSSGHTTKWILTDTSGENWLIIYIIYKIYTYRFEPF